MEQLWYVVGFAFAGVSFVFLTIAAAWLVSHRNRGDVHKGLPYESGIDTYGDTHGRFGLSFYIYALLFVAFDIEVVFIYLWAISFQRPAARRVRQHADLRGDPPARARLRLAKGGADMALTRTRNASGADATRRRPSARTSKRSRHSPAVRPSDEVMAPIVVPNSLWQAADPTGLRRRPTHRHHAPRRVRGERCRPPRRRSLERRPRGHPDQGRLRPRPDPHEQPVAAAVRTRLLRDRDDVDRDVEERHGPLGHVPVPGQPAPGRRPDRRRHADDEDGRPAGPAVGADARAQVVRRDGRLHVLGRPLQARATPRSRGSTGSCRSTCTCRAAHRVPRGSSTG